MVPLLRIHRTSFLDIRVIITWAFATDQIDRQVHVKQEDVKFCVQGCNDNQPLSHCHSPGPWEHNALTMSSYPMLLGYHNMHQHKSMIKSNQVRLKSWSPLADSFEMSRPYAQASVSKLWCITLQKSHNNGSLVECWWCPFSIQWKWMVTKDSKNNKKDQKPTQWHPCVFYATFQVLLCDKKDISTGNILFPYLIHIHV